MGRKSGMGWRGAKAAGPLVVAACATILAAQQSSHTVVELRQKFERRAQEIAARLDVVMAYTIVDLTSGDRFAHLETASLPTASTIKLAIVYELFKQVEIGRAHV